MNTANGKHRVKKQNTCLQADAKATNSSCYPIQWISNYFPDIKGLTLVDKKNVTPTLQTVHPK